MSSDLSPGDALSPEGFYSLYLGGLAIDDEQRRTDACYVLLTIGRLGIRSSELPHLHEGWIDWTSGELTVPAHDPCACDECWERASARADDDSTVGEILGEEMWSPPGADTARSLSFGWSQRLTAALAAVFDDRDYLDYDTPALRELVSESATNARGLEADTISLSTLRASAVSFLADAGFGPRRLAELLAIEETTAGEFTRVEGGERRDYLYRVLAETESHEFGGEDPTYRLVTDPESFDREPFDPQDYDADWRVQYGAATEGRERNPRPASPPAGTTFEPAKHLQPSEPAGDTAPSVVAESLSDWVHKREQQRHGETTDTAAEEAESEAEQSSTTETIEPGDPKEKVTEPVEFSIDTRFAAAELESGRPTGGSVVLGQEELLFLSRDDTGIAGFLRVKLAEIADLAPGYKPDQLAEFFDETVGIAHFDDDDERQVVVCEVPGDIQWAFVQTIFSYVLEDVTAVVSDLHLQTRRVTAEEMQLSADDKTLEFRNPETDDKTKIRLARVIEVEQEKMTNEAGYEVGLSIHYMNKNDKVVATEARPTSERLLKLLKRHLVLHRNRKRRQAKNASLTAEEREVLEALHNAGQGQNLATVLEKDPSEFEDTVARLTERELLRQTASGTRLTAAGFLVVSEEYGSTTW